MEKVNIDSLEFIGVIATKTGLEKVDTMVTTFLNDNMTGRPFRRVIGHVYQQEVLECVKIPATESGLEKVTNMVGTFFIIISFPFSNSYTITQIRGYLESILSRNLWFGLNYKLIHQ